MMEKSDDEADENHAKEKDECVQIPSPDASKSDEELEKEKRKVEEKTEENEPQQQSQSPSASPAPPVQSSNASVISSPPLSPPLSSSVPSTPSLTPRTTTTEVTAITPQGSVADGELVARKHEKLDNQIEKDDARQNNESAEDRGDWVSKHFRSLDDAVDKVFDSKGKDDRPADEKVVSEAKTTLTTSAPNIFKDVLSSPAKLSSATGRDAEMHRTDHDYVSLSSPRERTEGELMT